MTAEAAVLTSLERGNDVAEQDGAPEAPVEDGQGAVRFVRLPSNPDLPLPARASLEAAGHDIRCCEAFTLDPGGIHAVATGLIMELPAGIECQVRPRSGLAARLGLTLPNSPGTIDPDYRGELRILVQNLGRDRIDIGRGDRIAQLDFSRFVAPTIDEAAVVSRTERGERGLGSTGVN